MIQPATVAKVLIDDINRVLETEHAYLSSDDLVVRRYLSQANKLLKADQAQGHNVLGMIYALTGDHEKSSHHSDLALAFSPGNAIIANNKAANLSNLGFFGRAQELFRLSGSPEKSLFTAKWELGLCCGAFHTLAEFVESATRMELDLSGVNVSLINRAVRLMDEVSIGDSELAKSLDVVGCILREQKLFFMNMAPDVFVWDADTLEKHLSIIYKVGCPSDRTITLDEELGHRLCDVEPGLPFEIMLHIESGLRVNERFPERPAFAG